MVYGAYTSSATDRVTVLTHVLYPATVESYNIGLAHFNVRFPTVVRQHSLFITSSCAQSGNIAVYGAYTSSAVVFAGGRL